MEIGKPIRTFRTKPNIMPDKEKSPGFPQTNPDEQRGEPITPEIGIPVPNWPTRTKTPQKVEAEP